MSSAGTSSKHGWTLALERAAEAGDARRVGELLAAGATADVRLEGGATPLMRAAARGFGDVARALLDAGADANARRDDGFTPLILAVFFGHEEVVCLLLESGADPSAQTSLGVSARGWADARGFKSVGELLRQTPPPRPRAAHASGPRALVTVTRPDGGEMSVFGDVPPKTDVDNVVVLNRRAAADTSETFERASPRDEATPYEPRFETTARGFAWSWQAAAGFVLLAAACAVGAFALWQRSSAARGVAGAPQPSAVGPAQAAQPLPAPSAPAAAQLTPTPFVDPQAGALPPGAYIIQPDYSVQPVPLPPNAATSATVPAVVSESGAGPTPETPRREPRAGAAPPDAPAGRRDEPRRPDEDPRAVEAGRGNPEIQTPPRPSAPQPTPSPTPRSRVIQWPP